MLFGDPSFSLVLCVFAQILAYTMEGESGDCLFVWFGFFVAAVAEVQVKLLLCYSSILDNLL